MPTRIRLLRGQSFALGLGLLGCSSLQAHPEPGFHDAVSSVFRKVQGSVVHISAYEQGKPRRGLLYDPFFDAFFMQRQAPAQPRKQGEGSGFIFSREGLILTNEHVVRGADTLEVTLADERRYRAKVVGSVPTHDVAVVRISDPSFQGQFRPSEVAQLGDSTQIEVGSWAIAIGSPFSLSKTVTFGIVSALGRRLEVGGSKEYFNLIQTDAAINPGNSGGPLLNLKGEVIGINTAINAAGQGLGFALPINLAKKIADDLVQKGRFERNWMGIDGRDLTPALAEAMGIASPQGVVLTHIVRGGPADQAGLVKGDVVLRVRGRRIDHYSVLIEQIQETPTGSRLPLTVRSQGGQVRDVSVQILAFGETEKGSRASKSAQVGGVAMPDLGLEVLPLDEDWIQRLGLDPDLRGIYVLEVEPRSKGAALGLQAGDLILQVGRIPVRSVSMLRRALANMRSPRISILRDDRWMVLRAR